MDSVSVGGDWRSSSGFCLSQGCTDLQILAWMWAVTVEIPLTFKSVKNHITLTRMLYSTGNSEKTVWWCAHRLQHASRYVLSLFLLMGYFPCRSFSFSLFWESERLKLRVRIKSFYCIRHVNEIQECCFNAWGIWTSSSSPLFVPDVLSLENFHNPSHKWYFHLSLCKRLGNESVPILRRSPGACWVVRVFQRCVFGTIQQHVLHLSEMWLFCNMHAEVKISLHCDY